MPLVTVVIPTFNRSRELRLCLEGFANQTAPRERFEVIVVDDGSRESMADLCASFEDRLDIECLRQENRGPSVARNEAIRRARAENLLLYDDDLRPSSELVDRCIAFHRTYPEERDSAVFRFDLEGASAEEALDRWAFPRLYPFPVRAGIGNWKLFWSGTNTAKKSLFLKAPFHAEYRGLEDLEVALRLSRAMDLRVHYDALPSGTMTRPLEPVQIFSRFYRAGYYRRRICQDYPTDAASLKLDYDPEPDLIRDRGRLGALIASARSLQNAPLTRERLKMISALWTRAHAHVEADGWLAAREGRPLDPPGSIREFLER